MIEQFLRFRREPNNLSQFQGLFAESLTMTDLFVRGKVATLVGYPSTERDILLAQKRAKKDKALAENFEKNVRWTTIPQTEEDPKKHTNFSRYMYFSMTKSGVNRNQEKPSNDPVIKFMQYLTTSSAQETFFKNYEYYLPAELGLLASQAKSQIDSKSGTFEMIVSDWYVAHQNFLPYDKGLPHLFSSIVEKSFDEPGATATVISGNALSFLSCRINHLTDPDSYDQACECRRDVSQNNNNYWPTCSWGL